MLDLFIHTSIIQWCRLDVSGAAHIEDYYDEVVTLQVFMQTISLSEASVSQMLPWYCISCSQILLEMAIQAKFAESLEKESYFNPLLVN